MITWASRIKDLQLIGGMTLAEIGAEIGLSTGGVGDIATERTESPRGDAALKLHQLHLDRCSKKKSARASAA